MLQQRALQQSIRRLAVSNPSSISASNSYALSRLSFPAIRAAVKYTQIRPSSTTTPTPASSILAQQRLHRPVSPHLTIYQPQIPWVLSALNRITGAVISGTFYIFGFLYLVAPVLGLPLDTASVAAAFAAWPLLAQVALKFSLAWPFTFHSFNGVRHLFWDAGRAFNNQVVIRSGWVVVGISLVSALGLAAY